MTRRPGAEEQTTANNDKEHKTMPSLPPPVTKQLPHPILQDTHAAPFTEMKVMESSINDTNKSSLNFSRPEAATSSPPPP